MADYDLPDPVLSQIQGGFAPDPNTVPVDTSMPPVDVPPLHPAIMSYLTGAPQNLPPPPPQQLGPAPLAPAVGGGPSAAPEIADTVPSVTGGALPQPTDLQNAAPAPAQPDFSAQAPIPPPPPTPAERQQQAQQAAFAASPEGIAERADAQDRAGLQTQAQANQDASVAQQAQNDADAAARKAHQQRQAQQEQVDAAKQAEDAANVAKYQQQYAQQVQDAANYKVDTDRHVGAGGLIAIALSGIGNALDHYHGPNAAAQIIESSIDKRINDQWKQKDALAQKASGTAKVINQFRQTSMDDRQAQQLHTASELQKTADDLKLVAAQTANPTVKANALNTAGVLQQKSAAITAGEAQRTAQAQRDAQDLGLRKQALGLQYRAQDRADKQFDFEKQKWQDTLNVAEAKALGAKQKEISQWGISDPGSGNFLLQPAGQAKMAKADQLEAQARTQSDPAIAQQMRQQAHDLRIDANTNDVPTITNPGEHKEIVDNLSANQTLIDRIDDIQKQLADNPSGIDRSKYAAIKADWEEAKKDYVAAAATGSVTLSTRSMDAVDKAFGPDPDSFISREGSISKMKSALHAINQAAIDDVTTKLRSHHIQTDWVPHAPGGTAANLGGETAVEQGTGATPGLLGRGMRAVLNPAGYETGSVWDPETRSYNSAPFTESGLAPADEQTVRGLMAQSKNVNDAKYSDIVNQLAAYMQSPRASISGSVANLLRSNKPLYNAVLARLPADQQAQMRSFDAAIAHMQPTGGS